MSELIETGLDGKTHFIWLQEVADSCGPACVYMIQRIRTQTCPGGGEEQIRFITRLLPSGYRDGLGTQDISALALALRGIGIKANVGFRASVGARASGARFPFIAHVRWRPSGGHFVVCVGRGRSGTLTCLDPWFGLIEIPMTALPQYRPGRNVRALACPLNPDDGYLSGYTVDLV